MKVDLRWEGELVRRVNERWTLRPPHILPATPRKLNQLLCSPVSFKFSSEPSSLLEQGPARALSFLRELTGARTSSFLLPFPSSSLRPTQLSNHPARIEKKQKLTMLTRISGKSPETSFPTVMEATVRLMASARFSLSGECRSLLSS